MRFLDTAYSLKLRPSPLISVVMSVVSGYCGHPKTTLKKTVLLLIAKSVDQRTLAALNTPQQLLNAYFSNLNSLFMRFWIIRPN